MRGKTLGLLLNDLRIESRLSLNPAHNNQVRDSQVGLLQRVQETLWEDFDWPHLRVYRDIPLVAGQRYYDTPNDIAIDRIIRIQVRFGAEWCGIAPGIDAGHYATWDSDADVRGWPVERWKIVENEQIEVWPIPELAADGLEGTLRVHGIKKLSRLIADSDRAELDDRIIVLFAAAEHLASRGEKDAKLKLDQATKRYLRLRGNLTPSRSFKLFGGGNTDGDWHRRGPPRVHYRIVS
jgi:hypothetical protein